VTSDSNDPLVDPSLWVWNSEMGIGYIVGRAAQHPGSFRVWWPTQRLESSSRLYEIEGCSQESSYWLHGLLAGSNPPAWFGPEFEPWHIVDATDDAWMIEEDPRFRLWEKAIDRFERTGVWRYKSDLVCRICHRSFFPMDEDEEEGGPLPSDPVGDICWEDQQVDLESLWPRINWTGGA
jgi:hypothetical protein